MLTAAAMGVLADTDGVECRWCLGKCQDKDFKCKHCNSTGRLHPPEVIGWESEIEGVRDYYHVIRAVFQARERHLLPSEWLEQPGLFALVYNFLSPFIGGEFEDRREKLNAPDA